MNAGQRRSTPLAQRDVLVERYEQLRLLALEPGADASRGLGYTLLVQKGLTVWTRAWTMDGWQAPVDKPWPLPRPQLSCSSEATELVRIITQMVLPSPQEARA